MATADQLPPERDVKDFMYQQLCRFQINDRPSPIESNSVQLVAASSKYGLVFVGTNKGFKVVKTSELSRIDKEHAKQRTKVIIKDYPCQAVVELSALPTFLALSCDSLSLAVVVGSAHVSQVFVYDVRSFVSQGNQANPFLKIRLTCRFADLAWNPENPAMLVCIMEDGSISLYEAADNLVVKATAPAPAKATCVCWSPKGKQLVVGQSDGKLAQYDQTLVKKKEWSVPNMLSGEQKAIGVIWLSTFSFMVAYIGVDADPSIQPNVVLITGSKEAPVKYTSFEDPCFGGGEERQKKFFFNYIPNWEMIIATSNTAIEMAVLGKHFDNRDNLERWNLDDAARAEIPLTADHCEAFSMGVAIDFSSQMPLSLSEEKTLPPSPILLVLSSDGVLIPFNMIYTHAEAPVLTHPPAVLSPEGARQPKVSGATGAKPGQPAMSTGPSFQFVSSKPSPGAPSSFNFTSTPKPSAAAVTPKTSSQEKVSSQASASFSLKPTSSPGFSFGASAAGTSIAGAPQPTKPSIFGKAAGDAAPFGSVATPTSSSLSGLLSSEGTSNSSAGTGSGFKFSGTPATNSTSSTTTGSGFGFSKTTETNSTSSASTGFGFPATQATNSTPSTITGSGLGFSSTPATDSPASTIPISFNLDKTTTKPVSTGTSVVTQGQLSQFGSPVISKAFPVTTSASTGFKLGTSSTQTSVIPSQKPAAAVAKPEPTKQVINVKSSLPLPDLTVGKEDVQHRPTSAPRQEMPKLQEEDKSSGSLDSTYTHSIIEEMTHFEEELQRFRSRTLANKETIGNVSDMEKLKKTTEDIMKFSDDIKNNTKEQNKDVEDIKSLILDAFSMVEECRMREQRNADPKYIHLLRSKTLDPANKERLSSLKQKFQILDRGLMDCDKILDNEWEEYQNKNKKLNRIATPTTDLVYRSIKSNRNIILHQKIELDDLEGQLKQLRIYNKTSSWQDTLNESKSTELSSLADSLLESKTATLSSSRVTAPPSPQKMARLREHLSRRSVPRIKSTRPENLSMSRIVSAERRDPIASRSPEKSTVPAKTEPANSNTVPKMADQLVNKPTQQMTGSSLQQQAMNLTGPTIRFQQTKPPPNVINVGQPNITNSNQPGMTFGNLPSMTVGFNAAPRFTTTVDTAINRKTIPNTGIELEDITPPSSTGYEEDGEDGDTETETNDEDYGFGHKYNMPAPQVGDTSESETEVIGKGDKITSTPLSSAQPGVSKSGSSAPPSRNLFGSPKPGESNFPSSSRPFSFGGTPKDSPGFTFGSGKNGGAIPKTSSAFSFGLNNSAPASTTSKTSTSSVFNFSSSSGPSPSTFKFGQTGTTSFGMDSLTSTKGTSSGFDFSARPTVAVDKKKDENGSISAVSQGGDDEPSSVSTDVAKSASQLSLDGNSKTSAMGDKTAAASFSFSLSTTAASHKVTETVSSSNDKPTSEFSFSGRTTGVSVTASDEEETSLKSSTGKPVSQPATSSAVSRSLFGSTIETKTPLFGHVSAGISNTTGFGGKQTEVITSEGQTVTTPSDSTESDIPTQSTTTALGDSSLQIDQNVKTKQADSTSTWSNAAGNQSTNGDTTATSTAETSGQSTGSSLFGQSATSSTGLFGQKTGGGIFGKPDESTGQSSGIFGQASSSSGSSLFGQKPTNSTTSSASGLFGQATTTTSSTLFGQPSAAAPSLSSSTTFGQNATTSAQPDSTTTNTTSSSENLFLQNPVSGQGLFGTAGSSSGGLFGQSTSTTSAGSLFGQTSSTGGIFGQNTSASSSVSPFGQTTSSGGLFGQSTTGSSSGGLFGQNTTTQSTGGLFGQATSTSGGLFGQTTASSGSSSVFGQTPGGLFGQKPSTTSSGGLFGQGATTTSSGGVFGQTSSTPGTGIFGQPASSGTGLFGQPATTSSSGIFGQPSGFGMAKTTTTPAFGQSTFGQTSFGQTSSSPFGQTATTSSSSVFGGSMFGGLGGQPSAEKANTNVFGSTSFGSPATSSATSLFGNQGSAAFGARTTSVFGGGNFSGGGGSVASSGFGVTTQQQTSGFGGSPSFGNSQSFGGSGFAARPAFGTSPTFGGSGFGGQPSFGNPGAFGSPQPSQTSGGFAGFASSGSSPTFEALAGSSTVPTFGSLSHQGPGFGSSPGFGPGGTQSPGFGGFGSSTQTGFGTTTPPNNPSFTGYRS